MQNTTENLPALRKVCTSFHLFCAGSAGRYHHRAGGMGVHGLHQAECGVLRQPWALPAGFYWQNFVNAWNGAKMGEYMLNSVIVTALALALLLVVALPAAYCLSRFRFGCKVLNTLFMAGLFINVNYIVVPIF